MGIGIQCTPLHIYVMGVQIQHVIYTNVTQVDSRVERSQHIVKTVGHQRTHDLVFNVETLVYLPLVQSHIS